MSIACKYWLALTEFHIDTGFGPATPPRPGHLFEHLTTLTVLTFTHRDSMASPAYDLAYDGFKLRPSSLLMSVSDEGSARSRVLVHTHFQLT